MSLRFWLYLSTALAAAVYLWSAAPAGAEPKAASAKVDFGREVRPILSDKCFQCHGPDDATRMAGLRLDAPEGVFSERDGVAVVKPGDPAASKLYQRITHEQEAMRMPPPYADRRLAEEEIAVLRRWIEQGAAWEQHWAYAPVVRPEPPAVEDEQWVRNPVDYFVLKSLEEEGLTPSPEADRRTLLRRVSLDLTGLPPTPGELDAFLADESPNAYQKVVDRLLQSPHYGERMAMEWLDLARYADTHGFHIDSLRHMHPWRDWVINAYNANKPFDEFTIEQLAGDLLPNPTKDQLIATGFNRNHMINFEGGAIPEEYRNEYVIDRLETTATVWMGTTLGCARCHDHKYDPFEQKEFYRFYAFFNNIAEIGLDGQVGNAKPVLPLPSPAQKERKLKLEQQIETIEKQLPDGEIDKLVAGWRESALDTIPAPDHKGLEAHYEFHGHLFDTSGRHRHGKVLLGEPLFQESYVGQGVFFNSATHVTLGDAPLRADEPFSIAFWAQSSADKTVNQIIQKIEDKQSRRGFEVIVGKLHPLPPLRGEHHIYFRLSHDYPAGAIEVRTKRRVESIRSGTHVALSYDGSGKASGFRLYVDGEPWELEIVHNSLSGPVETSRPWEIGSKRTFRPFKGKFDDLRIYNRAIKAGEARQLAVHEPMRAKLLFPLEGCEEALARWKKKTSDPDFDPVNAQFDDSKEAREERACVARQKELRTYFLKHAAPQAERELFAELNTLRRDLRKLEAEIPTTMIMKEREKNPRETFVLARGDYRNKTDKVSAQTPAVLPPMPADLPHNRLGLANWLVSGKHPLTARVTVNRYWQKYFGTGLVKTTEDFGSQGERPSHAELLDWLAAEFVESGWDVKAMQRLIVTSAAYRQSSKASPELVQRDPENRLLARGPRFRLPAEVVRDNALAIAGLLDKDVGGPSVYPYQPPGLWKEMAFGSVFTGQEYEAGKGEELYRRSMYTVWKRTVPPPSLVTFDAPDREKCVARRERTNTPLQALVLMNDPNYVEASRAFAQRILHSGGSLSARLDLTYRLALARTPAPEEAGVLKELLDAQLTKYRSDPKAAEDLLGVGRFRHDPDLDPAELAAWTTVASTILSLDEAITKE